MSLFFCHRCTKSTLSRQCSISPPSSPLFASLSSLHKRLRRYEPYHQPCTDRCFVTFLHLSCTDSELNSSKSSFSMKFNTALWVLTTGVQFVVGWWYRSAAVFYLPPTWLGPLTWFLALPFAPTGALFVASPIRFHISSTFHSHSSSPLYCGDCGEWNADYYYFVSRPYGGYRLCELWRVADGV